MAKNVVHTADTAARFIRIFEIPDDGTTTRVQRLRADVTLVINRDDSRTEAETIEIGTLTNALDSEPEFAAGDAADFRSLLAKFETLAIRLYENDETVP